MNNVSHTSPYVAPALFARLLPLCVVVCIIWLLCAWVLFTWKHEHIRKEAIVFPYHSILRSTTSLAETSLVRPQQTEHNQVFVAVTVAPARTLVLGSDGTISEVWSNTAGNIYYYALTVRRGSLDGPLLEYTPSVHEQYASLISVIDWKPAGRVYPTPDTTAIRVAANTQQLATLYEPDIHNRTEVWR